MTTQHTPAPWESDYDSNGELSLWDQHGNNLLVSESSLPVEERKANGRLAASAPELLSALQEARDFIDCLLSNTPSEATDLLTNSGEEVEARLSSAIAKATQP